MSKKTIYLERLRSEKVKDWSYHNNFLTACLLEALERIEELEKQVKSVLSGGEHNYIISDGDGPFDCDELEYRSAIFGEFIKSQNYEHDDLGDEPVVTFGWE